MANIIYNDSSYRFSEPVRFFKANDPYYFEVDNIPLKQLQENCLWLRDQLGVGLKGDAGAPGAAGVNSVNRSDLNELKPYANGGDRIVRVKPGRYSARINNVSEKEKLGYLTQVMGKGAGSPYAGEVGVGDEYTGAVTNTIQGGPAHEALEASLAKFKTKIKANSLGMGGLEERAFTWPVRSTKWPFDGDGINVKSTGDGANFYGGSDGVNGIWNVPMPIHQALMWARQQDLEENPVNDLLYNWRLQSTGFGQLPYNESYWVKRWRGITKISIVDVPTELEIEVPVWEGDDFFYIDDDGNKKLITGAASRIDMVFIYSKPIDASGITIWKQGYPQKIYTPELGIVKGAGIGMPFKDYSGGEGVAAANITLTEANNRKMNPWTQALGEHAQILPSVGDQEQDAHTYGFLSASGSDVAQDVVGSFPSPDDIMNLAPLISNHLEENAVELVGQSILPVAYIFVQNNGSYTVAAEDIIDIRPLFRTTELAYNERAGIAAAMPQLSLANPAVGKAELTQALGEVKNLIPDIPAANTNNMNILAAGQVYGGWYYGVEAALVDFQGRGPTPGNTLDQNKQAVCTTYGYPTNGTTYDVPNYPDWDVAPWVTEGSADLAAPGQHVNDRINLYFPWGDGTPGVPLQGGKENSIKGASYNLTVLADGTSLVGGALVIPDALGTEDGDQIKKLQTGENLGNAFNFISKKYSFPRDNNSFYDYQIDVTFLNCLPMTSVGSVTVHGQPPQYGGVIWVEKGFNYFIIYVSTSTNNDVVDVGTGESFIDLTPPNVFLDGNASPVNSSNRGKGDLFANFMVPTSPLINDIGGQGEGGYVGAPGMGLCTYPSVTWKMTEIPTPRPNNYNTAAGADSFNYFGNGDSTNISLSK